MLLLYLGTDRNGRDENLLGNTMACRRLEVLLVNFAHGMYLPSSTPPPFSPLRSLVALISPSFLHCSHPPTPSLFSHPYSLLSSAPTPTPTLTLTLVYGLTLLSILAAASAYNHTLEPLDKKISKYLDGKPIRVDGQPRASGVLDTVRFFFPPPYSSLLCCPCTPYIASVHLHQYPPTNLRMRRIDSSVDGARNQSPA